MGSHVQWDADARRTEPPWLRDLLWSRRSKWGKFGVILLAIVAISGVASLLARVTVFKAELAPFYHVALIAPLSGPDGEAGKSLQRGAQLYVDEINKAGGIDGTTIALDAFDASEDMPGTGDIVRRIATQGNVLAVIGLLSEPDIEPAAEIFGRAGIPMIIPTHAHTFTGAQASGFSIGYGRADETRFLANYVRNISGDILTSIVVGDPGFDETAELFQTTFERFGAPIRNRWNIDSDAPGLESRMADISEAIKGKTDSGTLFLAMNAKDAAGFVKALRERGVQNRVVGLSDIGTRAFTESFGTIDYARYTNGILTPAPLLFDTADETAQQFRSRFLDAYRTDPDWVAAMGHDSVNVIFKSLQSIGGKPEGATVEAMRAPLLNRLADSDTAERGIEGVSGRSTFDADRVAAKPIQIGVYDGKNLISSLTQLQPIGKDEIGNYIQAVREGRALYVNDRFMYRTNVVYSGLVVKEIRDFDRSAGTFEMDFVIWFRYRGDFSPQDVIFDNAVEPIKLTDPDRSEKSGDLNYLSYSVVGTFNANFVRFANNYGTDLLGTAFRHRILDHNNLLYVVDVIGMGLVGEENILDKLRETSALAPSQGLIVDRAWVSQDVQRSEGFGSLNFVGNGKPQPDFSRIMFGAVALAGAPSLRDFIPNEYLIYIMIFALVGSVFAVLMDRKRDGARFFWNAQSWLLRVVCWPLLLISLGGLVLNMAFGNLEFYYVDLLVLGYRSMFWVVSAALVSMAIERFLWRPLEQRADRKIPGSVRAMTIILVYVFASFGVIGFVFNQGLTSLLASSGVAAMVVGLAIQGNLSNIFSGIVLNIERPFQVGDILRLQDGTEAEVTDITWRSIRVRSELGLVYSIPNSVATESEMIRVTRAHGEYYCMKETVHVAPTYDPLRVTALIEQALSTVSALKGMPEPEVRFSGTGGGEFAAYDVIFTSPDYEQSYGVLTEVWHAIWQSLRGEGIEMATLPKKFVAPFSPNPTNTDSTATAPAIA